MFNVHCIFIVFDMSECILCLCVFVMPKHILRIVMSASQ